MKYFTNFIIGLVFAACSVGLANAQTTEFTYQGNLKNGSTAASGNYDFDFALFDSPAGGSQVGPTLTRTPVAVVDGNFAVKLDFGNQYPGSNRFIEIRVRQSGGGAFTPLTPRQPVSSTPYSIKSLSSETAANAATAGSAATAANATNAQTAANALQLGGVTANQYVLTGDARLSDARNPLAGSPNYIQNQNAAPQSTSDFNISGTGTANILSAGTQFNIGSNRILGNPGLSNVFAGVAAGASNTNGQENSFFGAFAGNANTTGGSNSFFGTRAGNSNTTAFSNSFFGHEAGKFNLGGGNSFFGTRAGNSNTIGNANAFFGQEAGSSNNGSGNAFFGYFGGRTNTIGAGNTTIGAQADVGTFNLSNATAIGYHALVTQSNSLVLGSISGINDSQANTNVGIGTTAPAERLHVVGNTMVTGNLTVGGTLNANLPAGNANYIQNQNAAAQPTSDFNISGTGTASVLNVTTQYNIGGNRVMHLLAGNGLAVGKNAGFGNTTGEQNSFFGHNAGFSTTTGSYNSFFGFVSGQHNTGFDNSFFGQASGYRTTIGNFNSFFGSNSGQENTSGSENSFYGQFSGWRNTTGTYNSFFGRNAGQGNTIGAENTFVGVNAGFGSISGNKNSFVGVNAGVTNTVGSNNSLIGNLADVGSNNLTYAGAFGSNARVDQSNSIVLGAINGVNAATADTNVGIGTTAPSNRLHIVANGGNLVLGNPGCNPGFAAIGFSTTLSGCSNYAILGNATQTVISRPTGGVIEFREGNTPQASIASGGLFAITNLGTAGSTALCRNASNQLSTCSSSLRYKTNINRFTSGLELVKRLKPISFEWKDGGMHDLGLGAEDVAAIEPLLVTYNKDGQVEGVKYDRIGVVLINAVKEQQAQIEVQKKSIDELRETGVVLRHQVAAQKTDLDRQQEELAKQKAEIDLLKEFICTERPSANICKFRGN